MPYLLNYVGAFFIALLQESGGKKKKYKEIHSVAKRYRDQWALILALCKHASNIKPDQKKEAKSCNIHLSRCPKQCVAIPIHFAFLSVQYFLSHSWGSWVYEQCMVWLSGISYRHQAVASSGGKQMPKSDLMGKRSWQQARGGLKGGPSWLFLISKITADVTFLKGCT